MASPATTTYAYEDGSLNPRPDCYIDPALFQSALAQHGLPYLHPTRPLRATTFPSQNLLRPPDQQVFNHHPVGSQYEHLGPHTRSWMDSWSDFINPESGLFDSAPAPAVVPEQGPAVYEHALGSASPLLETPLLARGRSTSSELSAVVTPTGGVSPYDVLYGPPRQHLGMDLFPSASFATGLPAPSAQAYTSTLDVGATSSPFGRTLALEATPGPRNAKKRAAASLDIGVEDEVSDEEAAEAVEDEARPVKKRKTGGGAKASASKAKAQGKGKAKTQPAVLTAGDLPTRKVNRPYVSNITDAGVKRMSKMLQGGCDDQAVLEAEALKVSDAKRERDRLSKRRERLNTANTLASLKAKVADLEMRCETVEEERDVALAKVQQLQQLVEQLRDQVVA